MWRRETGDFFGPNTVITCMSIMKINFYVLFTGPGIEVYEERTTSKNLPVSTVSFGENLFGHFIFSMGSNGKEAQYERSQPGSEVMVHMIPISVPQIHKLQVTGVSICGLISLAGKVQTVHDLWTRKPSDPGRKRNLSIRIVKIDDGDGEKCVEETKWPVLGRGLLMMSIMERVPYMY